MSHRFFQTVHNRGARVRLSAFALLALVSLSLILLSGAGRPARGFNQDLARLNRFVQTGDSPSLMVFRQGRDLIEKEDWAGAAAKFEGFIAQYPKDKDLDAALYWHAYALKRQRKFQSAEERLERLVREFPRSVWVDDARAMQAEIAPQLGRRVDPAGFDDEELKIVALQSLFQSDAQRALAYVADILKPDSKAGRELKETAVSLLGQHGDAASRRMLLDIARGQSDPQLRQIAIHRYGQDGSDAVIDDLMKLYETERDKEVKEQILHSFSQMRSPRAYAKLLEVARSPSEDTELRETAIHWLGQRGAQSLDELLKILSGDRNQEVRAKVLHSLSQMDDPRAQAALLEVARRGDNAELRGQAIHWLGQRRGEAVVEELMNIYRADRSDEVRDAVLHALSQSGSPRARALLLEMASSGEDAETRSQAIQRVRQRDDAATLDFLVKLYDAERVEEVKQALLHAFGQSSQERALQKLMDIARGDASREMRKQAIHELGKSRDPRARKFIESLLQ